MELAKKNNPFVDISFGFDLMGNASNGSLYF